jgi:hypothetical protein
MRIARLQAGLGLRLAAVRVTFGLTTLLNVSALVYALTR